jgi:geranylgeranyl transferase type-2 subunit beta
VTLTVVTDIANLQDRKTGTFSGDEWGETDTRFVFTAVLALSLMKKLDKIDLDLSVRHIKECENFDGGFGVRPGAESHSGQIYTCVGTLAIAGRLDLVNRDKLGKWLSERQVPCGGLNGRPEKDEDVCYSWWVMSSMAVIGRIHWIDKKALQDFILSCQDTEKGGFADRPGDEVDVFHTHFAIAGLSLLQYPDLREVDPVYCMPKDIVDSILGR